jgi:peptidoglycan/xylan/chitin deacetylase (PgdA/CDA1 family)
MTSGTVYLMYHELRLPERELCDDEQGYARYVVAATDFRDQLAHLRANGFAGLSVTEALAQPGGQQVPDGICLTFDDGCETDLKVAAPELQAHNFKATFYVTFAHLERRGYLTRKQLRELSDQGFEIGCHSMNHVYLTDLPLEELRTEVAESKDRLEQITGKRVAHFSCPGGRWDNRIARVAEEAGYASVATSRIGVNAPEADRFCLSRVAVTHGIQMTEFARLCRGQGLKLRHARSAMLGSAKRVLGNSVYEKFRSLILNRDS